LGDLGLGCFGLQQCSDGVRWQPSPAEEDLAAPTVCLALVQPTASYPLVAKAASCTAMVRIQRDHLAQMLVGLPLHASSFAPQG
jgi:hypothetical protein